MLKLGFGFQMKILLIIDNRYIYNCSNYSTNKNMVKKFKNKFEERTILMKLIFSVVVSENKNIYLFLYR
jgi:hypothetical protein